MHSLAERLPRGRCRAKDIRAAKVFVLRGSGLFPDEADFYFLP